MKEDDDVESARGEEPRKEVGERKKKKRKKKTGKKMSASRSSEDNLDPVDEVEASVRWVEDNVGQPLVLREEKVEKVNPLKKVLSIENKHLNPENEMKRIFGSRVVASETTRHK